MELLHPFSSAVFPAKMSVITLFSLRKSHSINDYHLVAGIVHLGVSSYRTHNHPYKTESSESQTIRVLSAALPIKS